MSAQETRPAMLAVKDLAVNDTIRFHFPKCLNKHLFADTQHEAL